MTRTRCDCGLIYFFTPCTAYYSVNEQGKLKFEESVNESSVYGSVELECTDCGARYFMSEFELEE